MILVLLLYALFASVFTVSKTCLGYTQPLFFVGSRMALAGALMLLVVFLFKRKQFTFKKKHIWGVLLLAFFNIYLTNALEAWGLSHLTSFKTCFIYSLSPFVSALFSYWMFSEKMTGRKWLGLLVGLVGFSPILLSHTSGELAAGSLLGFSWAELAVVGAAVSSVYGWLLLRKLVRENGYSLLMANGLSMLIGGSVSLIHSSLVESWEPVPVTQWLPFIGCTLILIVVSNLVCYNLYGYLLRRYSATFMSFAGFSTPVFTAIFGWLYLKEVVTWPFYLSGAIVLMGLTLFHYEELRTGVAMRRMKRVTTSASKS